MMFRLLPSALSAIAIGAVLAQPAAGQDLAPPAEDAASGIGAFPVQTEENGAAETDADAEAEADAQEVDDEDAEAEAEAPVAAPDAGLPVPAMPEAAAPQPEVFEIVRDTFQDWEVRCAPQGDDCFVYQIAADEDDNPVAEFSLVRLPDGGEAAAGATVVTPLGTLLPAGLIMQIDGGEARQYQFTFCSQVGCFAQIALTQAQVAALQRGRTARLVVASVAQPNEPVELDLSLMGFTSAYNSLRGGD